MSDSRKYLLGATATIVAARMAARAADRTVHEDRPLADAPALKDEFVATYKELEAALDEIAKAGSQAPYAKKKSREDENLMGD